MSKFLCLKWREEESIETKFISSCFLLDVPAVVKIPSLIVLLSVFLIALLLMEFKMWADVTFNLQQEILT